MTIHRVDGYGMYGNGGSFDSTEARAKFGKIINVVSHPGSAFKIEQPMFHGKLRQDPSGVYQFKVTQHTYPPEDTVTFSATTGKDGRFVERLQFEKGGVTVTPSQPMAQEIFFGRIIKPIHDFLFGGEA